MGGSESKAGFQVARVIQGSPAHKAGLVPFFDFIIGVDNVEIEEESDYFKEYLKTHLEQQVILQVFNTKTRLDRKIPLTPSENWGGQGLLGCSITWEPIEDAFMRSWHILDVGGKSNAAAAGIKSHTDFVIGMQAPQLDTATVTMFTDGNEFHDRLTKFRDMAADPTSRRYKKPYAVLLVYDQVDNTVREILVQLPLGSEVGNGAMHTISSKGETRTPVLVRFASPEEVERASTPAKAQPTPPPTQQVVPQQQTVAAPVAALPTHQQAPTAASPVVPVGFVAPTTTPAVALPTTTPAAPVPLPTTTPQPVVAAPTTPISPVVPTVGTVPLPTATAPVPLPTTTPGVPLPQTVPVATQPISGGYPTTPTTPQMPVGVTAPTAVAPIPLPTTQLPQATTPQLPVAASTAPGLPVPLPTSTVPLPGVAPRT
eukprot:TRINITY_DN67775_c14_g1_i1.p1 TRINITY_DN67775_c14_g1~~TRINITY_DN67775_c14_g1_i1.p1  ORF type:complete len:428 (+),score=56.62 TRINITY_DN67775_c14_g1_i1:29-1312(+)